MSVRGYREETGLLYFIVMMILSVFYFLFFHASAQGVGILALGWSGITALRVLWFYYLIRALEFEENEHNRAQLPQQILKMMQGYKDRENGMRALRAVDASSSVLAGLIAFYLCWSVYVSFSMPDISAFRGLQNEILAFLKGEGMRDVSMIPLIMHNFFLQAALILMACFAFWQGMGFAFISKYRFLVLWFLLGLFALTLCWNLLFVALAGNFPPAVLDIWIGYGPGRFDILQAMGEIPALPLSSFAVRLATMGWIGAVLIYGAGAYLAFILCRGWLNGGIQRRYAIGGFGILAVMFLCDLFFERSVYQVPLWISGWSALAVCRAGIIREGRKKYRLH